MNCGCGSTYTLTPGDRLYLSALVKNLGQRVSALEGGGIGTDLGTFINAQIRAIIPTWALAPLPPTETDPTVPAWAKEATKPAYTVAEISGAASETYVDAHANRTDNPHSVTAAQIGAAAIADLAPVAFSGDYNDLLNKPAPGAAQVNSDWNATSGVQEILNKPVLGSAAASDVSDFATTAQGAKADTALQAGDVAAMAYAADAPNDGKQYARKDGAWDEISAIGNSWGSITGTLGDQTDLWAVLTAKADKFLTGLSLADTSAITDTDTVLQAVGKLQAGKSAIGHTHVIANVTGLAAALDNLLDVPTSTITSAAYTLQLSDRGNCVDVGHAITVPKFGTVAFPKGSIVNLQNVTAGNITITPESGATVYLAGDSTKTGPFTLKGYGWVVLRKIDSASTWVISGAGI